MVGRHKFAIVGWTATLIGFFGLIDVLFYTGYFILAWRLWVWIWGTRFGQWGRS